MLHAGSAIHQCGRPRWGAIWTNRIQVRSFEAVPHGRRRRGHRSSAPGGGLQVAGLSEPPVLVELDDLGRSAILQICAQGSVLTALLRRWLLRAGRWPTVA